MTASAPIVLSEISRRSRGLLYDLRLRDSDIPGAIMMTAGYEPGAFDPAICAEFSIPIPPRLGGSVAKRQADFLAGRIMGQSALRLLGGPVGPIGIGPQREPVWPVGVSGSISHANGICAVIAASEPGQDLGIDIEAIAEGRALAAIVKHTLSDAERAILWDGGQAPDAYGATLVFSAKESLFKALFPRVGHHFGFLCAELVTAPSEKRLQLRLTQTLAKGAARGDVFSIFHARIGDHVLTWLATT